MNNNYPQSRLGGNRGCLCKDNTYSIKCCDGSMYAQGIGRIYASQTGGFSDGFSDGFDN